MAGRSPRTVRLFVFGAGVAVVLSGCDGRPTACLPPEASVWTPSPGAALPKAQTGPVDVYMDGSGSMAGFIRGADTAHRPLQELVARMPWFAGSAALDRGATSYTLFGKAPHPLPPGQESRLVTEAPYACDRASPDCDNQETRLDLVLQRIAAAPSDHLAVVVTDLWLSGTDLGISGPAALSRPLSAMLRQGRALGVLGVSAPYAGPIYDIPNAPPYMGAASHPLFILLVGPTDRVDAFHARVTRAGDGVAMTRAAGWSLFTLTPGVGRAVAARPFQVVPGAGLTEGAALPPRPELEVQQLRLSRAAAMHALARGQGTGLATFVAAPQASIRPGAVWSGALTPAVQVWRATAPNAVCRSRNVWRAVGSYPGGWREGQGRAQRFALKADEAAAVLPPPGVYLLSGGLARNGLESPNPADRWMRDWSFNAADAPAVLARKPAFFPTLNLADTASLLEESLDQAAAARRGQVDGFSVVVRVDK